MSVRDSGVGPADGLEALDIPLARGKYLLERALFRGTRTTIFSAWQSNLDRTVWIELGHRELPIRHRSLSGLESRGLPRIYELGWDEERGPFAVLEPLTGRSLTERVLLSGRHIGLVEVAFLGQELLGHLDVLHDAGRTHAEIDPDHVWLPSRRGGVRLAFHPLQDELQPGVAIRSSPYHAPEQLRPGAGVDLRTDLYRLAATLYFALTGAPPFAATDAARLNAQILGGELTPPSRHGSFGRDVDDFFARALSPDASDRFRSVQEMARGLRLAALFHDYESSADGS